MFARCPGSPRTGRPPPSPGATRASSGTSGPRKSTTSVSCGMRPFRVVFARSEAPPHRHIHVGYARAGCCSSDLAEGTDEGTQARRCRRRDLADRWAFRGPRGGTAASLPARTGGGRPHRAIGHGVHARRPDPRRGADDGLRPAGPSRRAPVGPALRSERERDGRRRAARDRGPSEVPPQRLDLPLLHRLGLRPEQGDALHPDRHRLHEPPRHPERSRRGTLLPPERRRDRVRFRRQALRGHGRRRGLLERTERRGPLRQGAARERRRFGARRQPDTRQPRLREGRAQRARARRKRRGKGVHD